MVDFVITWVCIVRKSKLSTKNLLVLGISKRALCKIEKKSSKLFYFLKEKQGGKKKYSEFPAVGSNLRKWDSFDVRNWSNPCKAWVKMDENTLRQTLTQQVSSALQLSRRRPFCLSIENTLFHARKGPQEWNNMCQNLGREMHGGEKLSYLYIYHVNFGCISVSDIFLSKLCFENGFKIVSFRTIILFAPCKCT